MDYFIDVLTTFLDLEHGSCVAIYAGQKALGWTRILQGLEQHEGEYNLHLITFN